MCFSGGTRTRYLTRRAGGAIIRPMKREANPGAGGPILGEAERRRYARQVMLPGWGIAAQEQLKKASVLLLGCGGLGSPVALYLAAAGIGRLGLADPDRVETSNLQRQIVHDTASLGEWKTASAAARVRALNPYVAVEERYVPVEGKEGEAWVSTFEVIVDATDHYGSRLRHNAWAFRLGLPFVTGAVSELGGQVYGFDPRHGPPCYECLVPGDPYQGKGTAPQGIVGAVAGVVGSAMAMAALQAILYPAGQAPLTGRMFYADLAAFRSGTVALCRRENCPVCGKKP